MRVPSASAGLVALVALPGIALARAPAPQETPPPDTSADTSKILVPADAVSRQALREDLFTGAESTVGDPGRLEPLARHMLKFGPVDLLPKFDEEIVYDDNVFLTEHDKEADFIARTGLGALADYAFGGGQHHLTAGYDMLRNDYLNGDAKNFVEQFASAQLDLSYQHLKISVGDRWEDRTDPVLVIFSDKIERTINTAHGFVGWHEDAWYTDLRAQRVTTAFDDPADQIFDRSEDLASLEVGFLARDEAWAFVRADVFSRNFDNFGLNDGTGVAGSVGARFKRGDEIDSMVRVGLRAESFDDTVPTDADSSAVNVEFEGRLRWWVSRGAAIDARALRTTEFSPVSNYELENLAEVAWLQQLDEKLSARAGFGIEFVNPSNTSDTFTRWTFGAGVRYAVLDNADLTFNWRTRIRTTDAPNAEYTDDQFTIGFAIRL
jgi:opacity protein-like surface antigen